MKRAVRKSVAFLLKPYISFQNQINERLQGKLDEIRQEAGAGIEKLSQRADELSQRADDLMQGAGELTQKVEELDKDIARLETEKTVLKNQLRAEKEFLDGSMGAVARELMLAKWKIIDHLEESEDYSQVPVHCVICGHEGERNSFQTMEADCIFNGGHLVRYVCPECGAVFGPLKFSERTGQQIDDDYRVHYLGFSEGDSSYKEERAFKMLHPDKDKVYLNYGCGHWSKTLQDLRDEGYQVYGYEPYSPDVGNPYMITRKEELKKMRFDGIFSNDLLEHLLDPVSELREMVELLMDDESKMSHCTACYIYKYEYTRFHTCFFLGDSVRRMSELAGLQIVDRCDDMEENDFYCYVFRPAGKKNSLLDQMYCNEEAVQAEGGVSFHRRGILFGPYLTLLPRKYTLCVTVEGEGINATVSIYNQRGQNVFIRESIYEGENEIFFSVEKKESDVEFVIENNGADIRVTQMTLA